MDVNSTCINATKPASRDTPKLGHVKRDAATLRRVALLAANTASHGPAPAAAHGPALLRAPQPMRREERARRAAGARELSGRMRAHAGTERAKLR